VAYLHKHSVVLGVLNISPLAGNSCGARVLAFPDPVICALQVQAAIAACQPGDLLQVGKLDRLGRTMEDCISRVAELLDRDTQVRTLDGRVDTKGLGRIAKLVCGILAAAQQRSLLNALPLDAALGIEAIPCAEGVPDCGERVGQGFGGLVIGFSWSGLERLLAAAWHLSAYGHRPCSRMLQAPSGPSHRLSDRMGLLARILGARDHSFR